MTTTTRRKPSLRPSKPARSQRLAVVDLVLLVLFIPLYFEDTTGLFTHQVLGAVFGSMCTIHLAQHQRWLRRVTRTLFRAAPKRSRVDYFINTAMLVSLVACIGTGLIASTWLRGLLRFENEYAYYEILGIHDVMAWIVLGFVVIHLVRHRRWITTMIRRSVKRFLAGPERPPVLSTRQPSTGDLT